MNLNSIIDEKFERWRKTLPDVFWDNEEAIRRAFYEGFEEGTKYEASLSELGVPEKDVKAVIPKLVKDVQDLRKSSFLSVETTMDEAAKVKRMEKELERLMARTDKAEEQIKIIMNVLQKRRLI